MFSLCSFSFCALLLFSQETCYWELLVGVTPSTRANNLERVSYFFTSYFLRKGGQLFWGKSARWGRVPQNPKFPFQKIFVLFWIFSNFFCCLERGVGVHKKNYFFFWQQVKTCYCSQIDSQAAFEIITISQIFFTLLVMFLRNLPLSIRHLLFCFCPQMATIKILPDALTKWQRLLRILNKLPQNSVRITFLKITRQAKGWN